MSKKTISRSVLFLLIFMVVFSSIPVFRILSPGAYAGTTDVNFDETNVIDDLQSSDGFDIRDYPYNPTEIPQSPRIVNFVEYCYSYRVNQQKNFGLYLYVYNPDAIAFNVESPLNKIEIAVGYDEKHLPIEYEKFDLQYCNRSMGDYTDLFYKFKIVDHESEYDGNTILERVNSAERRYDVSGFEILTVGEFAAHDYPVGGSFFFSGYVKGYGPGAQTESTLTSKVTDLETVELNLHHATYLAQSGSTTYNQLHSVYFSVPKDTISRYGENLQEIKAIWYEYQTEMIAVLLPEWEAKFRSSVGKLPSEVSISDYMIWRGSVSHDVFGQWEFNYHNDRNSPLYWLLPNSGATKENTYIPAADLLAYLRNYTASECKGKINGKYSADLFVDGGDGQNHEKIVRINAGEKYSLLSREQNGFEKFMNWITGRPTSYPSFQIEKAIEPLRSVNFAQSDFALSSALYVNEQEVSFLRDYCMPEIAAGNYPYLFRFAVRDYETGEMGTNYKNFAVASSHDHIGFGARETVFLDFDIIQLKFFKDGRYYVVPVVSDPIDAIGGILSPDDNNPDCSNVKLLFGLLLLVVLLVLLAPVLPYLFRFLWWVICLPFRLIAWPFKKISQAKRKSKN